MIECYSIGECFPIIKRIKNFRLDIHNYFFLYFLTDCRTACFYQTVEISPISNETMSSELMTGLMKQCIHFQKTAKFNADGGYSGYVNSAFAYHTWYALLMDSFQLDVHVSQAENVHFLMMSSISIYLCTCMQYIDVSVKALCIR